MAVVAWWSRAGQGHSHRLIDARSGKSLRFDLHAGVGLAEDGGGDFRNVGTRRGLFS